MLGVNLLQTRVEVEVFCSEGAVPPAWRRMDNKNRPNTTVNWVWPSLKSEAIWRISAPETQAPELHVDWCLSLHLLQLSPRFRQSVREAGQHSDRAMPQSNASAGGLGPLGRGGDRSLWMNSAIFRHRPGPCGPRHRAVALALPDTLPGRMHPVRP